MLISSGGEPLARCAANSAKNHQVALPSEPEKAEIAIEGADHLYKEIRIENTLKDENGNEVRLKPGAEVEVTVEADLEATTPKDKSSP